MKPSFALNITDSTIGLLHRTARGWLQVGETQFDTADLAEALGYLRGSALGLSPGGLTTKLVLPNSQIKYLELDAPGPDAADRQTQIRAGLVGRTPYNVEDLVFDWSGTGAKVQVAVVARETLDEAEAFAAEHRFNPVSFVGQPAPGDFGGEPWFGPTKLASTLLEKGEKVDRDAEPVQIAARDLPKSNPAAPKASSETPSEVDSSAAPPPAEAERPTRAQRRAAAAAAQQARDDEAEERVAEMRAAAVRVEAPDIPPMPEVAPMPAVPSATLADAFPENEAEIALDPAAWPIAGTTPSGALTPITTPEAVVSGTVTDEQAFPEGQAFPEVVIAEAETAADHDLPPAPSAAIRAAFASRRGPDLPNVKHFGSSVDPQAGKPAFNGADAADQVVSKSAPPPLSRPKVGGDASPIIAPLRSAMPGQAAAFSQNGEQAKPSLQKPNTAFVTAPNIPGSRKRKATPQGASPVAADARKSLTKPGGTFASSKDRGKPRYLGLILTGLLLLFLALIAAWSSFFMASNEAALNGTEVVAIPEAVDPAEKTASLTEQATPQPAEQTAADIPAVDDEMLADSQDPVELAASGTDAVSPDVDPAADISGTSQPEVAAQPVAAAETAAPAPIAQAPTPEPAPAIAASTDSPSAAPLSEAQDEIFLTAIDAPPLVLDPAALPPPVASNDALPPPQLEPPPFGTVYQFDADGRIRPTPEGIITPEGVRLVAGKPSVLPPPRPATATPPVINAAVASATLGAIATSIPDPAAAKVPFPSDPALADARPKARPAGVVPPVAAQAGDGAALADPTTTRISSLRPLARPAAVLAAGEEARQSTAAASLTAQAEQAAAIEAAVQVSFQADPNASRLAIAVSRRPAARPKDMSRAVEAAVAAAVRAPETQVDQTNVDENSEPELASVAPSIPTRASVAKQATYVNAINLSKINLIGVYGSKSNPYALIRQSNGRYKKVKVGDSIDGGRVAAIGATEVRYQKSGRMISLKMPKT